MRRRLALAVVTLAACSTSIDFAAASGKIAWGSRVGMTTTVVHMSGLNTANAVIRTKHTADDALVFCRDYVRKISKDCIQSQLEIPLNDMIEGNCLTGEFTDFQGTRYRFLGEFQKQDQSVTAKYQIQEIASGQIADGTSASGYPVLMGIYRALCPRKAPIPGDEYWSEKPYSPTNLPAERHKLPFLDGVYVSDEKICLMKDEQLAKAFGDQLGNVRKVLKEDQVTWGWEAECKVEKVERLRERLKVVFACDSEGTKLRLSETILIVSNAAFISASRKFVRCGIIPVTTIRLKQKSSPLLNAMPSTQFVRPNAQ